MKTPAAGKSVPAPVTIDREQLQATGLLPEPDKERRFSAYLRQIKRPLLSAAMSDAAAGSANKRLIMLSSALPGDGKTFTSINLALSMARERDLSVLLVDGDVAKPNISRIFGLADRRGLMEALLDDSIDIESLVLGTSVPGLSMLPAGRPQENATELLASQRMGEVVRRLLESDPKRVVLLDSPPLLISTEARALIPVAGQSVLVVRSGVTPQQAMLDALELLGGGRCAGVILNDSHATATAYGYGYGDYG